MKYIKVPSYFLYECGRAKMNVPTAEWEKQSQA